MHDVAVIGGGPAGSRVASRLAEKGHSVLVLERKTALGDKCCTGIIGRECAEAFDVDKSVILRQVNSASLFSPSGNRLHVQREEIQACILDRGAFDKSMAERAQRAGAEYRYRQWVTGISTEPDKTVVTVSSEGEAELIPARCVVAACGYAPGLIRNLRLGMLEDTCYGAQGVVNTQGLDEVEVYFGEMAPQFFAWLVPLSDTTARAGLLTRHKPGDHLKNWLTQLAAQGKIASADIKTKHGVIPIKPLARTYADRLIAVGDAAGQVKPTSGGGIYYGLICADIAADTIHEALTDNDLSEERLAQYETAWQARLGKEIKTGRRARRMFERVSNSGIDRAFKAAKLCGVDEAVYSAPGVSFDWHGRSAKQVIKYRGGHPFRRTIINGHIDQRPD